MFSLVVSVKRVNSRAKIPAYKTCKAAGFDLASIEDDFLLRPGETKLVGTGLAFAVPTGFEMQIRPRSGLSLKTELSIKNAPGTIDSDYRGEVKIIVTNRGTAPIEITEGMRIAQGVIAPVLQAILLEVEELDETERGAGGFGHTGTK